MRRLSPRAIAIRVFVLTAMMVGCGSRGCGNESESQPVHQSESAGCSIDWSGSPDDLLEPIRCAPTLEALPFRCDQPGLVCNYDDTDSRVRCECNGSSWKCVDFVPDLSVPSEPDLGPLPNADLGEED